MFHDCADPVYASAWVYAWADPEGGCRRSGPVAGVPTIAQH